MRTNALLVRWGDDPGGWFMLDDSPTLRIEGTLGLGHIKTKAEASYQATGELDRFTAGQVEVSVGLDPSGAGDVPFTDWAIGDVVAVDAVEYRVVSLTVAPDPGRPGRLVYVPQLGDVVESSEKRLARASKKMTNGTLGGASRIATPLSAIHKPDPANCCAPTYEPGVG